MKVALLHLIGVDDPGQGLTQAVQVGLQVIGVGDVLKGDGQQLGLAAAHQPA